MQAKHVRETDPRERFEAVYLSEVLLLNTKANIDQKVAEDIFAVRLCLFTCFNSSFFKTLFAVIKTGYQNELKFPTHR